jgi:hypothetical protein
MSCTIAAAKRRRRQALHDKRYIRSKRKIHNFRGYKSGKF